MVGLSVLQMAREGIGLSVAQETHAATLFRDGARPGLILQYPGFMNNEQRINFGESFAKKFAGALNAGKTVILEGGMSLEPVGFTSEDSQFLESRHFSVIEIARWFRVPPTMIGDMTRVSYSSSESEMQLFAMHSLVPWCVSLEAEINAKLLPERTQFFVKFDVNSIIRGDQQSRYSAYSQGLQAGFLTVADVREAEGLPHIEGTELLNRPANMAPNTGGTSNGTKHTQQLEIKSLEDDGSFEGIAAAYGNVDGQGDRIEPGTFKAAEGERFPLLFAHKADQPVGFATVTETPVGLLVKGKLLLDTVAGAEAYSRMKAGVLKALSVGFKLTKDGFSIKAGVRVISHAVLKEVSLVVFPANPLAAVTAVKHNEGEASPLAPLLKWL